MLTDDDIQAIKQAVRDERERFAVEVLLCVPIVIVGIWLAMWLLS